MNQNTIHEASFRDPSGFMFRRDGCLYRQVNFSYKDNFDAYIDSGLHQKLVSKGLIINHEEVQAENFGIKNAYKILKPELIPYITYPYEWSFTQLKDAAILTLDIQLIALSYGFTLKDASAFNVQFYNGKPIFIDTLSFEKYSQGPWIAYKQYCQHFFAPLILRKFKDRRLARLSEKFIDGVPLDLASQLLPKKTWLNFAVVSHIHIHSRMQSHYADCANIGTVESKKLARSQSITNKKLVALVENLKSSVSSLQWKKEKTEWGNYYESTNYNKSSMQCKCELIEKYLNRTTHKSRLIADIGANSGQFSRLAKNYTDQVVSFDIDEVAVEKNYLKVKVDEETGILPVVLDLFNPSSAIGWENCERESFIDRANFDIVIALALIHHLAISNNVPLNRIARLFHRIVNDMLIIEFVPKGDSQVNRLLSTREDIFHHYNENGFEQAISDYFTIEAKEPIKGSMRTLYCLKRKQ